MTEKTDLLFFFFFFVFENFLAQFFLGYLLQLAKSRMLHALLKDPCGKTLQIERVFFIHVAFLSF